MPPSGKDHVGALCRFLRQQHAQNVPSGLQVVDPAAVVHDHRRGDGQRRCLLPESAQRPARGEGEQTSLADPARHGLQIPGIGRRDRVRAAAGQRGLRILKGVIIIADQQHSVKFPHDNLLYRVSV